MSFNHDNNDFSNVAEDNIDAIEGKNNIFDIDQAGFDLPERRVDVNKRDDLTAVLTSNLETSIDNPVSNFEKSVPVPDVEKACGSMDTDIVFKSSLNYAEKSVPMPPRQIWKKVRECDLDSGNPSHSYVFML